MSKFNLHPLSIALVALFTSSAYATEQEVPHQLSTIVVTAAGFEQKLTDAPASISVVTEEDLRNKPYMSLIDAVRDLEGVDVGETSDKTGQRTISIRGMGSDYTLILVDGKRQSNHGDIYPNSFGGNQFNHVPPLDAIERIEVIRGPASTLYGADALGGVINIITKKVTNKWSGSATIGRTFQENDAFGDDTTVDFNVLGPIIKDVLGLGVRGSFYKSDASTPEYDPVQDPAGVEHSRSLGFGGGGKTVDRDNWSVGLSLHLKPTSNQTLSLDYDRSEQKYDNKPVTDPVTGTTSFPLGTVDSIQTIWAANGSGVVAPRIGYSEQQKFTRDSWAITHTGDWDFGHSFVSLSHVATNNKGRTIPFSVNERQALQKLWNEACIANGKKEKCSAKDNPLSKLSPHQLAQLNHFLPRPARILESRQTTLDAKLDLPFEFYGGHNLVTGTQITRGELEDGVFGLEKGETSDVQKHQMYSIFVEDNWQLIDPFTLTLGLRYDNHEVFGDHFSPRIYGVYNLTDAWTIKGGVATGFKTPKTTDLYDGITGFGGQGTSPFVGTPDLKPETSTNSELALYWTSPSAAHNFNITLFHNNFDDKIVSASNVPSCQSTGGVKPCANLGEYVDLGYTQYSQKVNVGKAITQGVELAGKVSLPYQLALRGNYTYTDSEQKKTLNGTNDGLPLTNIARHMLNTTLDWQPTDALGMFLTMETRDKRYRGISAGELSKDASGSPYYKGYTVFHLGASYKFNPNVTINGRINNLFDKDFSSYQTTFAENADGTYTPTYYEDFNNKDKARNYWLSLNFKF